MALKPITRQEKIIAGQNLTPITRMEKFLKQFGGDGGDLLETVAMEVPLEITWDGDLAGKETASSGENGYYVKISDIIISNIEDIIDSKIVLSISGVDNSMVVAAENVMDVSENGMPAYIVSDNDGNAACLFVKEDFAMGEEAMSSGIWFNRIDVNGVVRYTKSLTCPNATTTITKQQIKTELLPEGYPYDAGGFSYTNSVYKDGDELIDDEIFRVSEDTPSYEDLLGANFAVNMAGNVEGILTSEMVLEYVEGKLLIIELLFNRLIIVVYEDNLVMDGEQIPYTKKGVYMMKPPKDGVGIYSISKTTIVPIASEFLPKITIVQDGYNNAAAGVSTMATSESYTCTANATYAEVLQALQNKNVPTTELYYHGQGNGVIGVAKGGATYLHVETDGNLYIRQEFYINGGYLLVVWGANGEISLKPNI